MSFLTQLGTYWLQGKLLHECGAAVQYLPVSVREERKKSTITDFFFISHFSGIERKNTAFPSSSTQKKTELDIQSSHCVQCKLLIADVKKIGLIRNFLPS